jgi:hypothetical protein
MICIKDAVLFSINKNQFNKINKQVQKERNQKLLSIFCKSMYKILDNEAELLKISLMYKKYKFIGK